MSLCIRTDITSVKLYKSFIFAGIGSWLNVFDKISMKFLQRIHALLGQKIHGIVPSKFGKLLVFGGKQFTIFDILSVEKSIELKGITKETVCDDWLLSGIWINEKKIALLTAHNVIQIWDTSKRNLLVKHKGLDNCILYSGLLFQIEDDILVFSGTVFSEVIVHRCNKEEPIQRLNNHSGVIFSVSFKPEKEIIVTTSDDRSLCIWSVSSYKESNVYLKAYWDDAHIVCKHSVYGHRSRVMRSCIANDMIISASEDTTICFWNYKGEILSRKSAHQNGCVWSIDVDDDHLVSGGGDSGLVLHPLTFPLEYGETNIIDVEGDPKEVCFTARNNIVILNETDLIYYDTKTKVAKSICKFDHKCTYQILSLSSCKQMIAVVDMQGNLDIFLESYKNQQATLSTILNTKLQMGEIYSMHWAGCKHLVFGSKHGINVFVLILNGSHSDLHCKFLLPSSKQVWLTAAAMNSSKQVLAVGDKNGDILIYVKGKLAPIGVFRKVHGMYGPTSIKISDSEITTTGRDGTVRTFLITKDNESVRYMNRKTFQFKWIEKFAENCDNILFGFHERHFVAFDIDSNMNLLEIECGGGHRSWDAIRHIENVDNEREECITVIFYKNSKIQLKKFQLHKIFSRNVIKGSHSKEINCLRTYITELDHSPMYYITGGEDTTLRISSINEKYEFKDEVVFKHLSSIRTLKTYFVNRDSILIMGGGGRAQITLKFLQFQQDNGKINLYSREMVDYTVKDQKMKVRWLDDANTTMNPQTRVMDLDAVRIECGFMIFAACSDAALRVYEFDMNKKVHKLTFITELNYHTTCILKSHCTKILNRDILITCTTRGIMSFWDIHDKTYENLSNLLPFLNILSNQSGINGFTSKIVSDTSILIATGGDDNSVCLKLLECTDKSNLNSLEMKFSWKTEAFHSSQVTGVMLLENYLLSTSVDQRITLFQWKIMDDGVVCDFITQVFSDVPDIHGMDLLPNGDHLDVCVYGKGMEVIRIK